MKNEGKIITLTVEETERIADKLKDNGEFYFLQTGNIDQDTVSLFLDLMEKIEQAEGKK